MVEKHKLLLHTPTTQTCIYGYKQGHHGREAQTAVTHSNNRSMHMHRTQAHGQWYYRHLLFVQRDLECRDMLCLSTQQFCWSLRLLSVRPPRQGPAVNVTYKYCAVLCCAVLCCAVLCCAVLCCAVLCCALRSCRNCRF